MDLTTNNYTHGSEMNIRSILKQSLFLLTFSIALILLSFQNYLAFHVIAEFFTVGVAILMFVVIWHTYDFSKNHFLMLLGVGYLWIGLLDATHTMLYYGMPTALDKGNFTSQFWIATRFFESLLLLISPFYIQKTIDPRKALVLFGSVGSIISAMIFIGVFPDTFVDGKGLTAFKIISEYVIITILIGAIVHLRHRRQYIDHNIYQLIMVSISLTIGAELAFTFYVNMYGISNLIGHIFKLFSFWLIYTAIIRTSLIEPFRTLNHTLQATNMLHDEAQRLAKLGHWSLDITTNKLYWSDEVYRIFEVEPERFKPSYEVFINAIHPDDRDNVNNAYNQSIKNHKPYNITHRLLMKDGRIKYVNEQGNHHYDEMEKEPLRSTGTIQDITVQKLFELEIKRLARTDPLTQLSNRIDFNERLDDAIRHAKRNSNLIGLAMLDLDGFKPVNDTYGHQVGDEVLKEVATRLLSVFREVDTIARFGGDEFVIILDTPITNDSALKPLERALELLQQPISVGDFKITIGASAGIAFFPTNSTNDDELIRMADEALYEAKHTGKNNLKIFN